VINSLVDQYLGAKFPPAAVPQRLTVVGGTG